MAHLPKRVNKPGPILDYLEHLRTAAGDDPKSPLLDKHRRAVAAVRAVFSTEEGRILMELLEKSTTGYFLAPDADPCALSALNAQRFIALDLQRIASDEIETVLGENASAGRSGRRNARR